MTNTSAASWIERWDRQQERYVPDREERFAVIGDVLAHQLAGTEAPVVLDLGCGPGSLGTRLAERLPGARVIGVDSDPLLLSLGAQRYRNMEFVDADLATGDWTAQLPSTVDAAVSTTALHWLPPARLAEMYAALGALMRPGGVFVNGDHLGVTPGLQQLARFVRDARTVRAGVAENQDWAAWWVEIEQDEELKPLLVQRQARRQEVAAGQSTGDDRLHHGSNALTVTEHANLLRAAGFAEVGTVWQSGDDHVLAAIR